MKVENEKMRCQPILISEQEYEKILEAIRGNFTDREELIVRLMYEFGFRIEEVLGLTDEDFLAELNGKIPNTPVIYLRNRLSDQAWQCVKRCMPVWSRSLYATSQYQKEGAGYIRVVISEEMLEQLDQYFEETHTEAQRKYGLQYWDMVHADRIAGDTEVDRNVYVFLSDDGTPLTLKEWNQTLEKIFIQSGITLHPSCTDDDLNEAFHNTFLVMLGLNVGMDPHETLELIEGYERVTFYNPVTKMKKT